jgi:hypothetical protein
MSSTPPPEPTHALPHTTASQHAEAEVIPQDTWPGFPFPPPLMGIAAATVDAAAAHWLRAVANLLATDEMSLNTLFASAPLALALDAFSLPTSSAPVIRSAGTYALGSFGTGRAGSISSLFAAPPTIQLLRLRDAAAQLPL